MASTKLRCSSKAAASTATGSAENGHKERATLQSETTPAKSLEGLDTPTALFAACSDVVVRKISKRALARPTRAPTSQATPSLGGTAGEPEARMRVPCQRSASWPAWL